MRKLTVIVRVTCDQCGHEDDIVFPTLGQHQFDDEEADEFLDQKGWGETCEGEIGHEVCKELCPECMKKVTK